MTASASGADTAAAVAGPHEPAPFSAAALPWGRRALESAGLSLAGGLLLAVTVRYSILGPLIGLAYALLLLPAHLPRWRMPVLFFFPALYGAMVYTHWPLKKFGGFVPWAICLLLFAHYIAQPLLAALLRRTARVPAVVAFPLCAGAGEWLREYLGTGSFNMYQVGTFLYEYPRLIQLADIVGSLGLSVLWMIPCGAAVDAVVWHLDGRPRDPARVRTLRRAALASAVVLVLLPAYGTFRLATSHFTPGPRIAVIQPSLDHSRELTPAVTRQTAQMTVEAVKPGTADLVAWPENAILAPFEESPEYLETAKWVAGATGAPLLLGAQGFQPGTERSTNSAFLVEKDGTVAARYDKVVLFPFTERRALRPIGALWPWFDEKIVELTVAAWQEAPDGWSPDEPGTMTLRAASGSTFALWTPICYESCYAWLGRHAASAGARVIVNLTSEGWLGWGVSNNQMGANVLRAVENRMGMVRVGNTGPSAFVLPDGRVDAYLRGSRTGRLRLESGTLVHTVMLDTRGPTFFTRFGAFFDNGWIVALAAVAVAGVVRTRRAARVDGGPREPRATSAGPVAGPDAPTEASP